MRVLILCACEMEAFAGTFRTGNSYGQRNGFSRHCEGLRVNEQSRVWQYLRAGACVALTLLGAAAQTGTVLAQGTPSPGQTTSVPNASPQGVSPTAPAPPQAVQNDTTGIPGLPQAPKPVFTQPLFMRPTSKDYAKGNPFWPDPLRIYAPKDYPAPRLGNAPKLGDLLRDGK